MQQMSALIETLIIFLIIIIIGYILGVKKVVKPTLKDDLGYVLLRVTLPAMLMNAIVQPYNEELIKRGALVFALMIAGFGVCCLVGYLFMKMFNIEPKIQGIWLLGSTFPNIGYMGFPVISAMFGAGGLFLASIANVAFNLIMYSFGILMVSKGQGKAKFNWKVIFLNNVMISIFLALILYFTRIELSGIVRGTLSSLGDMTGPLSMLVIGLKLSEFPLKEIFNNRTQYQMSFVRLIAAPIVMVLLLKLLPLEGYKQTIQILAILNAMPVAGNTTIMANEYGGDEEFAAKSTTLSSILCLVTMPLIFLLIG